MWAKLFLVRISLISEDQVEIRPKSFRCLSHKKMSERQTKAGNQEHFLTLTRSHSLTVTLSHSLTLTLSSHSFTHSWHAEQLLFSCLCWKVTLSLSHSLTLTLSHSLTLTLSHSHTLSVSHSWHAEQLLFSCLCSKVTVYRWKWQWFFFDSSIIITLTCYFTVHRACSQLKRTSLKSWV